MQIRKWVCLASLSFFILSARASELVVIVSAKNPTSVLSVAQVADIFLGQSGYFPGGQRAIDID